MTRFALQPSSGTVGCTAHRIPGDFASEVAAKSREQAP